MGLRIKRLAGYGIKPVSRPSKIKPGHRVQLVPHRATNHHEHLAVSPHNAVTRLKVSAALNEQFHRNRCRLSAHFLAIACVLPPTNDTLNSAV